MTTKPWKIKQGLDTFGDGKSLSFDLKGHEDLLKRLKSVATNVKRELNVVANLTAKFAKSQVAKEINAKVMITQAEIKKALRAKRHSSTRREIILKYDRRWSLKHFKPRQNRKGVSYRIERGGPLKRIPGAFMGPVPGRMNVRWKGSVWKRIDDANPRSQIKKVYAVSPWGVAVKNHMFKRIAKDTGLRMRKEMRERIRAIVQGFVK